MLKSMSENPIVFAMANPDPEINYNQAKRAREDLIIATGRSDHPNQVKLRKIRAFFSLRSSSNSGE